MAYTEYRSALCTANPKVPSLYYSPPTSHSLREFSAIQVVICVHGLTRNSHDFDYLAPAIAALHQYVVYSVDVVGRGRSDYLTADSGENYGYPLYIKVRCSLE